MIGKLSEIRQKVINQINEQNMQEFNFITPIRSTKNSQKYHSDAHMFIGIKGKDRKGSAYVLYLKNLMKRYGLKWKYARLAIWNENIYIEEGTSNDGYLIHSTRDIYNKDLLQNLFNGLSLHYSNLENDKTTVQLRATKFNKGFLLTTI